MKTFTTLCVCVLMLAGVALAGAIDGKWVSERKMSRNGNEMTIIQTFDLKSDGGKLTGSVAMKMGDREPRSSEIKDGKIDGNKFSFTVTTTTQNGEMKTTYEGTVDGDTLKGTAAREGGEGRPFEAKKQ
ncbi:hypothetical protein [uncultured Paludibaculum sp.]|uniref:hypothetical protein n=1 Tax=uncultured Paludibaculum sp. TaxID=1765020 RepID=UPI002AAC075F|nr:hypothetical protein [uncultured Paludibaculum sp.]